MSDLKFAFRRKTRGNRPSVALCVVLVLSVMVDSPVSKADTVDDYIATQMRAQHIPGLSLAVVERGKVVLAKGYGLANVELTVPATAETVYRLASVTKPLTAVAIMLLVEEGKLTLDDGIARYVKVVPENWRDITIRQLLSHSTGIVDYLNQVKLSTKNGATPQEILEAMGGLPLNFEPGSQTLYSNTNYLILGMIIERITGMRYDAFLRQRVFDPLGMEQTQRNDYDKIIPHRASGYHWSANELKNSPRLEPSFFDNADAGLLSSVLDLVKWSSALDGDILLRRSSRTLMWTPTIAKDGKEIPHGLGWVVAKENGHRMVYHSGNREDGSAFVIKYPDDRLTVILLMNLGGAHVVTFGKHVAGIFNPELTPKDEIANSDAEPTTTRFIKDVLLRIQAGTPEPESFTPEMWKDFHPAITEYLRRIMRSAGELESLAAIAQDDKARPHRFHYRAAFAHSIFSIDFELNEEGKITTMSVAQE